jgi:transglutaminase-like putative cysteine protease
MTHWPAQLTREARDTLWLLGMLALVLAPHVPRLPWWSSALAALALGWRAWLAVHDEPLPRRPLLMALLAATMACTWLTFGTVLGREAGTALVVMLTTLKSLELRARRDALVCLYLGFFLVLTQFLYDQGIFTALLMLAAVWGLLVSLVLGQRPLGHPPLGEVGREAGRNMLVGLPVMVLLFVLFPRFGPLWALPSDAQGRMGLSDQITLGDVGSLAASQEVALRVKFDGTPPPMNRMYFRGPVLDHFDGQHWQANARPPGWQPDVQVSGSPWVYDITVEPQALKVLPLLDGTGEVMPGAGTRPPGLSRRGLQWDVAQSAERLRLRARAWPVAHEGPLDDNLWLREWVQLPPGRNPRTLAWALALRQQPTWREAPAPAVVAEVLRHIRTADFRYTLSPGRPPANEPHLIDRFWFDQRAGFCEHFASAFVVVLRAMDIPSRVVLGYQGAEFNPVDGQFTVRQSHAHAWAEYWQAGQGWVRVDPTAAVAPERIERPPQLRPLQGLPGMIGQLDPAFLKRWRHAWEAVDHRWNTWVLQYANQQQMSLLQQMGLSNPDTGTLLHALGMALGLLGVGGAAWASWQALQARKAPWPRLLAALDRALSARHTPPEGPRPASPLAWARQPEVARQTELVAHLQALDALRYGTGADAQGPTRGRHARLPAQARDLLRQIERICRHNRGF